MPPAPAPRFPDPPHVRRLTMWACLAWLVLATPAGADLFNWSEDDGLFSNGFNWFNATTNTMHAGPPGAGDIAGLCGDCTITADGGSVGALSGFGETIFAVTAPFSADLVLPGGMTVTGAATLTAGDINSSLLRIAGGHVTSATAEHTGPLISASGVLHVTGEAADLSGAVDGLNSTLQIDGNASDLNFAVSGGGKIAVILNLTNGLDQTLQLDDEGSRLEAANLIIESGFLDVAAGATVGIGQVMSLGIGAGQPPSGGLWTGAGTSISTGLALFLTGSSLSVQNGAHVETPGMSLAGATAAASLDAQGAGTTVAVGGSGLLVGLTDASTLTLGTGAAMTVAGDATIGSDALSNGQWNVTGAGTSASVQGDLRIGDAAQSIGRVSVTGGATLQLAQGAVVGDAGAGTLTVGSGGQVTVAASGLGIFLGGVPGAVGTLNISGTGSAVTTNGKPLAVATFGSGSIAMGPGGSLTTGPADVGNVLGTTGSVSLGADASWVVNGALALGGNTLFAGTGIVQVGTGALVRATTELGVYSFSKVVLGGGRFVVGSGVAAPSDALRVTDAGLLKGDGLIDGDVDVESGGTVAPGNALGQLSVDGDYTQRSGGTLAIEVGLDVGATLKADRLSATGTADLDGTLVVTPLPGFTPAPGQTFRILTAADVRGKFKAVQGAIATYRDTEVVISFPPPFAVDAVARCAKGVLKAGGAFANARSAALGSCVQAALKCVETVATGPTRDACLTKVGAGCTKQFTKIDGAAAKLRTAFAKACAGVGDDVLRDAIGLGFDGVGTACAQEFTTPLTTLASITECVLRQHACGSDAVVGAAWPRASEMLGLAGVPPSTIAGFACLPENPGGGADLGDPKGVGKAATRCTQKAGKAAEKLVATRLKALRSCATATFACVSNKATDPTCSTKATGTCDKAFAALAKTTGIVAAALAKSCGDPPLAFGALAGAAGANLNAGASVCADVGVPTVATLDDFAECLLRQATCATEALLRFEAPRADALFAGVGRAAASVFCL